MTLGKKEGGKKKKQPFQLVLWHEKCLFREALRVATCYLLSNLEASNVGCFIDGAGILDDVFRKFIYVKNLLAMWKKHWRQCYCSAFTESIFFLFPVAIHWKSLEKSGNLVDFSQDRCADYVHNTLVICHFLNIWLGTGICFYLNTLIPSTINQICELSTESY